MFVNYSYDNLRHPILDSWLPGISPIMECGGRCAGERRRQGRLPPLAGNGLPLVGPGAGAGRAGGDVGAFIARANSCLTKKYSLN
jgi:hypothetical protein